MSASDAGGRVDDTHRAIAVAALAGTVAVLGALATGRLAFAVATAVSAGLGYVTMTAALRRGRDALMAGAPTQAGVLAGALLGVRLLGVAALMLLATVAPSVLDLWGVVAGVVAADVTLLLSEGMKALVIA